MTSIGAIAFACAIAVTSPSYASGDVNPDPTPPVESATDNNSAAEPEPAAPPKVDVANTKVPLTTAGARAKTAPQSDAEPTTVANLEKTKLDDYRLVGVTWSPDSRVSGVKVDVRVRTNGEWSRWRELAVNEDEGDEGGVPGTDPLWVGRADGVAARVTSDRGVPKDIKLATINPGSLSTDSSTSGPDSAGPDSGNQETDNSEVSGSAAASARTRGLPPKPAMIRRSQWGASRGSSCDSPRVGPTTMGAVMHHTAGSNNYSASQSKSLVRGIQAYHTQSRGWCDVGYNFLIDKYGQIFEGRKGGIDRNVRAAHAGNSAVNTNTVGVSLMGNLDNMRPTAAMKTSAVKLVGWRLGRFYRPATGKYTVGGRTLQRISGHRNVVSTGCPGRHGYAWLSARGGMRDRVSKYLANRSSRNKARAKKLGTSRTGSVYVGEHRVGPSAAHTSFGRLDLYSTRSTGSHTVSGRFRSAFNSHGAARLKTLGYPAVDSPKVGRAVTAQRMTRGGLYYVPKKGTFPIWGASYKAYSKAGGRSGRLGPPQSTIGPVRNNKRVAKLKYGRLEYNLKTEKATAYDYFGRAVASSRRSSQPTSRSTATKRSTNGNTKAVPSSGVFRVYGRGFGHGIGMGQYGAEGAARKGKKYNQILAHYYRGTKLSKTSGRLRVLISADTTDGVLVKAQRGMRLFFVANKKSIPLSTQIRGKKVSRYEIVRTVGSARKSKLRYRTTGSKYTDFRRDGKVLTWSADAQFYTKSTVSLILPGGSVMKVRGSVRSAKPTPSSGRRDTVNSLPIDSYLRGVIAAEMPASWSAEALKSQAVAARTYAVRSRNSRHHYDTCSTTACQVYGGVAKETAATNRAVGATSKRVLTYRGRPALTQYSSSTGGYSATGSEPYLRAVSDRWDGWSGNKNRSWSVKAKASTLERAYRLGKLKKITVTKRNGKGAWGGRVQSVRLAGTSRSVTISGDDARWALGLKSNWFKF